MKNENLVVISNNLQTVLNRIVYDELDTLSGRYSLADFKSVSMNFIKKRDIDVFILDSSVLENEANLVDALKFLRTVKDNMRIIVVAPKLKNEAILSAITSLGIYDIVNPDVSQDDGMLFTETLTSAVNHAVDNPKNFSMVASLLKLNSPSAISINQIEDNNVIDVDRKLRTYLFYKEKKKYNAIITKFENHERFNIVGASLLSSKEISSLNLLKIDVLLVEEPNEEEAIEILNIVKVLKNKVKVIGFYADFENFEGISSVPELEKIVYNGDADDLSRVLRQHLALKTRQITQTALEGRSKVVALIGQKGGCGKTSISVMLGHMFSKKVKLGLKVCVIDFNVFAGDIAVKYGIQNPVPNFYIWAKDIMQQRRDNYDVTLLKNQIMNYLHYIEDQSVYVMPNTYTDLYDYVDYPTYDFDDINFALEFAIDALKEQFDVVILDTTGYGPNVDIAILKSSDIFIVSDTGISGLYQAKALYSRLFNSNAVNNDKIKMILSEVEPSKKYKAANLQLAKEFFDNKIFSISYDKEMTANFEKMKINPSRKLVTELMPICDSIVPVFKKKK